MNHLKGNLTTGDFVAHGKSVTRTRIRNIEEADEYRRKKYGYLFPTAEYYRVHPPAPSDYEPVASVYECDARKQAMRLRECRGCVRAANPWFHIPRLCRDKIDIRGFELAVPQEPGPNAHPD